MTAVEGHSRPGTTSRREQREEPLFGSVADGDGVDYVALARTPEFTALRRKQRRFVFPMSLLFMAWFLAYVLLSAYAHRFMATKVLGQINLGIVMGLAQFLTTVVIMLAYCWYADRTLDAAVDDVHRRAGTRS